MKRASLGLVLAVTIGLHSVTPAASVDVEGAPDSSRVGSTSDSIKADPGARRYLTACAGCHRLEGAKLNGPALAHVSAWPPEQLQAAIKRMEKNVGPLSEADLGNLGDFLRSPHAKARLAIQEEQIRAQFAKTLAPADAGIGRRLFRGEQGLANGGLACASCHRFAGVGGRLGPDLSDVVIRLGKTPLTSGIANASYKVMAPHYQRHPITAQEAAHLAEYLAGADSGVTGPRPVPILALAGGGAALAFTALAAYFSRGRRRRGSERFGREA